MNRVSALLLSSVIMTGAFASTDVVREVNNTPQTRIIGGQAASEDYDYFVTLMFEYSWGTGSHWNPNCGGSYIGDNRILTAAHCVTDEYGNLDGGRLGLLIGDYSNDMAYEYCSEVDCITRDSTTESIADYEYTTYLAFVGDENEIIEFDVDSSQVSIHPAYGDYTGIDNDFAVIHLSQTPSNTPVNLPSSDLYATLVANGVTGSVRVIGHGDTIAPYEESSPSAQLLEIDVTPRTDVECISGHGIDFMTSNMICAGDVNMDSCQGDSGGPLIDPLTNTVLGVVSWGEADCASATSYGVYADVYSAVDWIKTVQPSTLSSSSGGSLGFVGTGLLLVLLMMRRQK